MKISVFTFAAAALSAVVLASSASAGIYPGQGCGCVLPCIPY